MAAAAHAFGLARAASSIKHFQALLAAGYLLKLSMCENVFALQLSLACLLRV